MHFTSSTVSLPQRYLQNKVSTSSTDSMASSTTPTKRRAINQLADRICQLRSRVETVDAAYALQDLDPDKETIDPQTEALISQQTAHQLFKKAR